MPYAPIPTPFPSTIHRQPPYGRITLTQPQLDWLRRYYPVTENPQLIRASGLSHSTLHRYARELHLEKSPKGLRAIKRRQAAHIKRVCQRNGYYDSLRGRPPSQATREATARMWQDIREGRREHPAHILRRENPRRYRKWMQRKSEQRREAFRKEELRMIYGLERKTRLHVVLTPYRRSQVNHRLNALRRGYILEADCSEGSTGRYTIYYDADTPRSPLFERNCIADGFTIQPWTE